MEQKTWWVYMVQTQGGRLYTGITTDPERRLNEHLSGGKLGARFFRTDPALAMVYREMQVDRSAASKREAEVKKYSRTQKLAMAAAYLGSAGEA